MFTLAPVVNDQGEVFHINYAIDVDIEHASGRTRITFTDSHGRTVRARPLEAAAALGTAQCVRNLTAFIRQAASTERFPLGTIHFVIEASSEPGNPDPGPETSALVDSDT